MGCLLSNDFLTRNIVYNDVFMITNIISIRVDDLFLQIIGKTCRYSLSKLARPKLGSKY